MRTGRGSYRGADRPPDPGRHQPRRGYESRGWGPGAYDYGLRCEGRYDGGWGRGRGDDGWSRPRDGDRGRDGWGGSDRSGNRGRPANGQGRDYWWLGERELERQGYRGAYDGEYLQFSDRHHPRFSPVGGMHPAMGGSYAVRRPPPALRENMRLSEWTRWF